jgi:predicted DNA-binding transcriptional regulator YafY
VYVSSSGNSGKALNEAVYYNIDAIHNAINTSKQISFKYFKYNIRKRRVYRKNGEAYIRTPVAMCWNEDKYYLITYSPKHDNPFASYRVDRMANVDVLDADADKFDRKAFSISGYIKRNFGMFGGETVSARLAFDEELVSVVLDYFGSDVHLNDIGNGRFAINTEVAISKVFLGWIFQLGDKAEILKPESLRQAMRDLIEENGSIYRT